MASKIILLDEATINRIAAGEVIERPASVVKELVENSLDAGATRIEISVSGGGLESIKVTDDGSGMGAADAERAFERHATSKIRKFDDLMSLGTLGFRGEALASVAAVSDVELLTRSRDDDVGTAIVVHGGKVTKKGSAAREPGTTITVRKLFANVPARLKYMRTERTETSNIVDVVTRMALARPGVSFALGSATREIIRTNGDGNLLRAISGIFGRAYAQQMVPVSFRQGAIEVSGFAAKPSLTRSDAAHQSFFVNARHFSSQMVSGAVQEGYGSLVMKGRHPAVVLALSMPPSEVDVNVHPTKREVRFRDDVAVYDAVREAIRSAMALVDKTPAPSISSKAAPGARGTRAPALTTSGKASSSGAQAALPVRVEAVGKPSLAKGRAVLGQIMGTYILVQDGDSLLIVDQHAAHERIVFEGLKKGALSGKLEQKLLDARAIEADPRTMELVAEAVPALRAMGFDIEPFGGNAILVRGVPVLAGALEDPRRLSELVTEMGRIGRAKSADERRDELLHMVACHSAIRAGERLSQATMERVVVDIEALEAGSTCPHGRPTRISITRAELDRLFGRRG
ncbi:MAG: DNA mismatch repair endonuclease MutL [Euryarchaeota archaeon]|nr:DNA mismatch repair endonuclease MutL [Euryarchaeota archaeon]